MDDGRLFRIGLALTLVAAAAVGAGSLVPLETLPPEPGTGGTRSFTRLHHLVGYAGIVLPVVAARPRAALWAVPAAIGYGGLIELIQPHVGRDGTLADALANALGAVIGGLGGWALHRLLLAPVLRWLRV
jgi:VanZ family protein